MIDLTVYMPIHELDSVTTEMARDAIKSFESANKDYDAKLFIVVPENNMEKIKSALSDTYEYLAVPDSNGGLCEMLNYAVSKCNTKYFSMLEYDDNFTPIWFKNFLLYKDTIDASVYLPLTEIVDYKYESQGSVGYVNEATWATSFSDEIGYLSLEALLDYPQFSTSGAIFKTSDFIDCGKLKTSMKLTFWYELMLRMLQLNMKIYVIPKVGYIHLVNREGSMIHNYSTTLSDEEEAWWFDLAKKEYFFKTDRCKTFEE